MAGRLELSVPVANRIDHWFKLRKDGMFGGLDDVWKAKMLDRLDKDTAASTAKNLIMRLPALAPAWQAQVISEVAPVLSSTWNNITQDRRILADQDELKDLIEHESRELRRRAFIRLESEWVSEHTGLPPGEIGPPSHDIESVDVDEKSWLTSSISKLFDAIYINRDVNNWPTINETTVRHDFRKRLKFLAMMADQRGGTLTGAGLNESEKRLMGRLFDQVIDRAVGGLGNIKDIVRVYLTSLSAATPNMHRSRVFFNGQWRDPDDIRENLYGNYEYFYRAVGPKRIVFVEANHPWRQWAVLWRGHSFDLVRLDDKIWPERYRTNRTSLEAEVWRRLNTLGDDSFWTAAGRRL